MKKRHQFLCPSIHPCPCVIFQRLPVHCSWCELSCGPPYMRYGLHAVCLSVSGACADLRNEKNLESPILIGKETDNWKNRFGVNRSQGDTMIITSEWKTPPNKEVATSYRVLSGKPDHQGKAGHLSQNRNSKVLGLIANLEFWLYLLTTYLCFWSVLLCFL